MKKICLVVLTSIAVLAIQPAYANFFDKIGDAFKGMKPGKWSHDLSHDLNHGNGSGDGNGSNQCQRQKLKIASALNTCRQSGNTNACLEAICYIVAGDSELEQKYGCGDLKNGVAAAVIAHEAVNYLEHELTTITASELTGQCDSQIAELPQQQGEEPALPVWSDTTVVTE